MMRGWRWLPLLAAGGLVHAADNTPTVGELTRHNGLQSSHFYEVRTPTILPVGRSAAGKPDLRVALDHYDRIADLPADDALRAEALRRSADIRVEMADAAPETDPGRAELLARAMGAYRRLIKEIPGYAHRDQVYYQLARAESMAQEPDASLATLRTLGRETPDSPLAAEAHFRAAEILFASDRVRDAESEYAALVAKGPGSQFYEVARYKDAWALYKEGRPADAIPVLVAILDADLPAGPLEDPDRALSGVKTQRHALARESLRLLDLCLIDGGGGDALNAFIASHGEPRFSVALYRSLGAELLQRHRYSDAAGVFSAYVQRHPDTALAPQFQAQVLAAYRKGDFDEPIVREEEHYVTAFAPGAAFWHGAEPPADVRSEVLADLAELGPYHQHRAQQMPAESADRAAESRAAAKWYAMALAVSPQDPGAAQTRMRYADSLYDGGQVTEAAAQYEAVAYATPAPAQAAEAGYALVQVEQRAALAADAAHHDAALRAAAMAGERFANSFAGDPHRTLVLTQASEDYFNLKDYDAASASARRVIDAAPPAAEDLRQRALGLYADARFAQRDFDHAEGGYAALQAAAGLSPAQRQAATEARVASAYKVGEIARDRGDLRGAASAFDHAAAVSASADSRRKAEFDEATALVSLHDWKPAARVLEAFGREFPRDALAVDAEKKLGYVYEQDANASGAAEVYGRLARRAELSSEERRSAAWLSARMYDGAQRPAQAEQALAFYVETFPEPIDQAQQARRRLADLALSRDAADPKAATWLRAIVSSDHDAGRSTTTSRFLAAQACLQLGRAEAGRARGMVLTAPLAASVARRQTIDRQAIADLTAASAYGFSDIAAEATYAVGDLYSELASAISGSQRPANLKGETLEQYNVLLIEQVDAFEQKAVSVHETNLARVRQGIWNDWVRRSAAELARLAPDRYGKHEMRDDLYDSIL